MAQTKILQTGQVTDTKREKCFITFSFAAFVLVSSFLANFIYTEKEDIAIPSVNRLESYN